ncbi:MAG: hypothetical protein PF503_06205 [Desulfobacula sp.]|jgi:cell wall-associated NlpC family hydrolase|nr:hypothetical protein [Desulfobacula sp.]
MDIPYFENNQNWLKLWEELESWKGTPYRHLTMVKGRGADCTLFIGGVWKTIGILSKVNYEYYSTDWHEHTDEEMVIESIMRHHRDHCNEGFTLQRFGPLETDELIRGDILLFNYPARGILVSHHAAVWIGTIFKTRQRKIMTNSIEGRGVCQLQYGSFWQRRLTNVFRVMEG